MTKLCPISKAVLLCSLALGTSFGSPQEPDSWSGWQSTSYSISSGTASVQYRYSLNNKHEDGKYLVYVQMRNEGNSDVEFNYCIDSENRSCTAASKDGTAKLEPHAGFKTQKLATYNRISNVILFVKPPKSWSVWKPMLGDRIGSVSSQLNVPGSPLRYRYSTGESESGKYLLTIQLHNNTDKTMTLDYCVAPEYARCTEDERTGTTTLDANEFDEIEYWSKYSTFTSIWYKVKHN